jgi:sortase A
MRKARGWQRRLELVLWIIGISLLGAASGATVARWNYQAQQERALFEVERGPAIPRSTVAREVAASPEPAALAPAEVPPPAAPVPAPVESATPKVETPRRRSLDPSVVGRLEIPALDMNAVVREGDDNATLARAVGLIPGSAQPGEVGNIILAGHRDTFFRPLRDIRVNDRIRFVVSRQTYEYRVRSTFVVDPEDTAVLKSKGIEELTLVTCYPFRMIGPAPDRFIVNAVRVN